MREPNKKNKVQFWPDYLSVTQGFRISGHTHQNGLHPQDLDVPLCIGIGDNGKAS
jgi:hypothetical protein